MKVNLETLVPWFLKTASYDLFGKSENFENVFLNREIIERNIVKTQLVISVNHVISIGANIIGSHLLLVLVAIPVGFLR